MKRRTRNLRFALAASALVLALGATQAAVVPVTPQTRERQSRSVRAHQRPHFQGWVTGALSVFRFAGWIAPAPASVPSVYVPPSASPTLFGGPEVPLVETTARESVDSHDPI